MKAILQIHKRRDETSSEFIETTTSMMKLDAALLINPKESINDILETKVFLSMYDVCSWQKDGYNRPLVNYKGVRNKEYYLIIRNREAIRDVVELGRKLCNNNCFSFLRYLNSSHFRRVLVGHYEYNK